MGFFCKECDPFVPVDGQGKWRGVDRDRRTLEKSTGTDGLFDDLQKQLKRERSCLATRSSRTDGGAKEADGAIDTACTRTVASSRWMKRYLRYFTTYWTPQIRQI